MLLAIRISPLTGPGVLLDVWISVLKMTRCAAGCVDFRAKNDQVCCWMCGFLC
jgi:hypothetical protein